MTKSKNPDPSQLPVPEHRLNVLLEELNSKFDVFGEGLADVQEKVSEIPKMREDIQEIKADISTIKTVIPTLAKRLTALEAR